LGVPSDTVFIDPCRKKRIFVAWPYTHQKAETCNQKRKKPLDTGSIELERLSPWRKKRHKKTPGSCGSINAWGVIYVTKPVNKSKFDDATMVQR